jgi:hypothetical protein
MTADCKIHNDELYNLHSSPSMIRVIKFREDEMGRACSTKGEKGNAKRILVGKAEGTRPLGKPRHR